MQLHLSQCFYLFIILRLVGGHKDTQFGCLYFILYGAQTPGILSSLFTDVVLSALSSQPLYFTPKPARVSQLFGKCKRLTEQGHGIVVHRI